jgi:hypothetical protein
MLIDNQNVDNLILENSRLKDELLNLKDELLNSKNKAIELLERFSEKF